VRARHWRDQAQNRSVGIFPNEAAIVRLVGAILIGQNDEWSVQRARYLTLETMAPFER
jgi:putative transposase